MQVPKKNTAKDAFPHFSSGLRNKEIKRQLCHALKPIPIELQNLACDIDSFHS